MVQIKKERSPVKQMTAFTFHMVAEYIRSHAQLPSQKAVQRAYQQETGQMLNWEAIKAAIAQGKLFAEAEGVTQAQRNP